MTETLLQVPPSPSFLPWVSFLLGIGVSVMQIYIAGKMAKTKEEILDTVRKEIKEEIKELKKDMVTKEALDFTQQKLGLQMQNILFQINQLAGKKQQE